MNPLIEDCLLYLEGQDDIFSSIEEKSTHFKQQISNWDWQIAEDKVKTQKLLCNILTLVLLDMTTNDPEAHCLKVTALNQLSLLELSDNVKNLFNDELDQRLFPYTGELFRALYEESLDELIPLEKETNVLQFKRSPQNFIDSYYAMAAHSGMGVEFESPIPPLEVKGDYLLSCAFPDPDNYCRVWFELRKEDVIARGVVDEIVIGEHVLSFSSGECELLLSRQQLAELLEGRLNLQLKQLME